MKLLRETEGVLRGVEEATGTPVEIVANPELPLLARITRARAGMPAHVLQVNPSLGTPDYVVVYEAAFLLRQFAYPRSERCDFAGTREGIAEASRLFRRGGQLARVPDAVAEQVVRQVYDGLMTQLRSYPIGMRIDAWINEELPALDASQREAVARQQKENLAVLRPDVHGFAPKPLYEANVGMNAAYAIFCDRVFGKAGYSIPYRSAGFEKRGRALLEAFEAVPSDPLHDRDLVAAWASDLGLDGWYQWVPIQP